jgi:hypothetical protein
MNTMRMLKRVSGWTSLVLVVSILLTISGAQAAVPIVGGGGELLGATGVNVGGTVYDVQIVEGTCVDLYDGCDDLSDFTFTTFAGAELAAQAIFEQVYKDGGAGNFDTVPNLTGGCSGAFCGTAFPYGPPNATKVGVASAVNQVDEAGDFFGSGTTDRTFDSSADPFHTLTTWAVWTPTSSPQDVPISAWPAAIMMLALSFRSLRR